MITAKFVSIMNKIPNEILSTIIEYSGNLSYPLVCTTFNECKLYPLIKGKISHLYPQAESMPQFRKEMHLHFVQYKGKREELDLQNKSITNKILTIYNYSKSRQNIFENLIPFERAFIKLNNFDISNYHRYTNKKYLELFKNNLNFIRKDFPVFELDNPKSYAIPSEIGIFTEILKFTLEKTQIQDLPKEMEKLTKLKEVCIKDQKLPSFPVILLEMPSINEIYMPNTGLKTLPTDFSKMTSLKTLALRDNELTEIPPTIIEFNTVKGLGKLPRINTLQLSGNKLTTLPPELSKVPNLIIEKNPIVYLPGVFRKYGYNEEWFFDLEEDMKRLEGDKKLPARLQQLTNKEGAKKQMHTLLELQNQFKNGNNEEKIKVLKDLIFAPRNHLHEQQVVEVIYSCMKSLPKNNSIKQKIPDLRAFLYRPLSTSHNL